MGEPATGYLDLLAELKHLIASARSEAAVSINRSLIGLFWSTGRAIEQREEFETLEADVTRSVASDLRSVFPGNQAFAEENIARMRRFFLAYTRDYLLLGAPTPEIDGINLPEALACLPWAHNLLLVEVLSDPTERLWYAQTAREFGWTLDTLRHQIENRLYEKQGKIPRLFEPAVVDSRSAELAQLVLQDPLVRDLIRFREAGSRPPEKPILHNIRRYLLGMNGRFALVGSPFLLQDGTPAEWVDQLLYQLQAARYVAVKLVVGVREQAIVDLAAQMAAIDSRFLRPANGKTLGLIIEEQEDECRAAYVLPGGAQVASCLPEPINKDFPSVEDWAAQLKQWKELW